MKSNLKPELERLSKDIKSIKSHVKHLHREYERLKRYYNVDPNISFDDICYCKGIISPVRDELLSALDEISKAQHKKYMITVAYRATHIIYSLYNGTPMEKIEGLPYTREQINHLYYGKREISYDRYLMLLNRLSTFNTQFYRYNMYHGRITDKFFESDTFIEAIKHQQKCENYTKLRNMMI